MRMASIGRATNGIMVVLSDESADGPKTFVYQNLEEGFRAVLDFVLMPTDEDYYLQVGPKDAADSKRKMN